jgi:uncharacterized damage-inducible protein DinB
MTISQVLATEFEHEAATTRRHLERLPDDKLGWRPHEKSFTLGGLASHIIECVGWADGICSGDQFDFDPASHAPIQTASVAGLLAAFDDKVAAGQRSLARITDADLAMPWRLSIKGKVRFEKPRLVALRDFTLSHLIHHRGQLSVYLRLLEVPVPGSYGPTADERG